MKIITICGNCGKEIPENTDNCPFCNVQFEEDNEELENTVDKDENILEEISSYHNPSIESEKTRMIYIGIIYPIIILISGYVSSLIFKWLSHTLYCLHTLSKKK